MMPLTDSQMIQQNLKCDVCVCVCLSFLSENHPSATLKKHTIQITAGFVYKPWSKEISPFWPKYQSFSFSISPSNEHPGLISFRMDWFNLLAVQGTLKSLLQHHSSKASVLWCSAFFMVQLSHPYMTTGKTIALTRWTFVGKVMSLPFNMLSKFEDKYLLRSKHLLLSWLQPSSAVILEPKKIVCHCFHCFFIYLP